MCPARKWEQLISWISVLEALPMLWQDSRWNLEINAGSGPLVGPVMSSFLVGLCVYTPRPESTQRFGFWCWECSPQAYVVLLVFKWSVLLSLGQNSVGSFIHSCGGNQANEGKQRKQRAAECSWQKGVYWGWMWVFHGHFTMVGFPLVPLFVCLFLECSVSSTNTLTKSKLWAEDWFPPNQHPVS